MAGLLRGVGSVVGGAVNLVGGVAGGVVGVAGGVAGNVVGGVKIVSRHAFGAPEKAIHDDEEDPYQQRTRVDQVLHFFEREADRYEAYVPDRDRLESLRIEYYNCINAVEFQHELIAQAVDDILELRARLKTDLANRKDICIELANRKLDISDRKNKRFFKEKERQTLLETLCPLIAEVKMKRLLEEQEHAAREPEDCISQHNHSWSRDKEAETEIWGSVMEAHETTSKARRRYKQYSDEELTALLREKDN